MRATYADSLFVLFIQSHVVVAFPFTDLLERKEQDDFKDYVAANASTDLQTLLKNWCNQRFVCLNNTLHRPDDNKQMKQLSDVIQDVVYFNGGKLLFNFKPI